MSKERIAIVRATGEKVNVYKSSQRDEWIVFPGCSKSYKPNELAFTK